MKTIILSLVLACASFPLSALTLLWGAAEDVDGYRVYSSTSIAAGWTLLEDIGPRSPGASGYIEYTTPDPTVLTLYQVRAYNAGGEAALEHIFTGFDPDTTVVATPTWPKEVIGGQRQ